MATSQSGQIIPLTSRSWLKSLARRERKKLTLAAICGVLAGGLTVLLVVGLAWAIDQLVIHGRSPASLTVFFLGLMSVVLLRSLLQAMQRSQ